MRTGALYAFVSGAAAYGPATMPGRPLDVPSRVDAAPLTSPGWSAALYSPTANRARKRSRPVRVTIAGA